MGFFDRFKRRNRNTPTEVVKEPKPLVDKSAQSEQFVKRLQESSTENLSSEQLKSRFIQFLDIDSVFKNNPIVKNKIMKELEKIEFKTIDDIEKFKDTCYVEDNCIFFENGKMLSFELNNRLLQIDEVEQRSEMDIGSLSKGMRGMGNHQATFTTSKSYSYDLESGVEMSRTILELKNQQMVFQKSFNRDKRSIKDVRGTEQSYNGDEKQYLINLAVYPGDISTLDGVEASQMECLKYNQELQDRINKESHYGMLPFDTDAFYEKVLQEKIENSNNRAGCYKYLGENDLNRELK